MTSTWDFLDLLEALKIICSSCQPHPIRSTGPHLMLPSLYWRCRKDGTRGHQIKKRKRHTRKFEWSLEKMTKRTSRQEKGRRSVHESLNVSWAKLALDKNARVSPIPSALGNLWKSGLTLGDTMRAREREPLRPRFRCRCKSPFGRESCWTETKLLLIRGTGPFSLLQLSPVKFLERNLEIEKDLPGHRLKVSLAMAALPFSGMINGIQISPLFDKYDGRGNASWYWTVFSMQSLEFHRVQEAKSRVANIWRWFSPDILRHSFYVLAYHL